MLSAIIYSPSSIDLSPAAAVVSRYSREYRLLLLLVLLLRLFSRALASVDDGVRQQHTTSFLAREWKEGGGKGRKQMSHHDADRMTFPYIFERCLLLLLLLLPTC